MIRNVSFSRVYRFSAAHRLHSGKMSDGENQELYDKCNNLNGHGHDYTLEVTVEGQPDDDTGMIISMNEMDAVVRKQLSNLDYKHLDKEVAFFRNHVSTGENIIQYLWRQLDKQFGGCRLFALKLWETRNNYFELVRE